MGQRMLSAVVVAIAMPVVFACGPSGTAGGGPIEPAGPEVGEDAAPAPPPRSEMLRIRGEETCDTTGAIEYEVIGLGTGPEFRAIDERYAGLAECTGWSSASEGVVDGAAFRAVFGCPAAADLGFDLERHRVVVHWDSPGVALRGIVREGDDVVTIWQLVRTTCSGAAAIPMPTPLQLILMPAGGGTVWQATCHEGWQPCGLVP